MTGHGGDNVTRGSSSLEYPATVSSCVEPGAVAEGRNGIAALTFRRVAQVLR